MGRKVYLLLSALLTVLAVPILLMSRRGRSRFFERFGFWGGLSTKELIWFHGASVGEIVGLIPIMEQARAQYPQNKILLTATSVTGLERGAAYSDFQRLLPFDNEFLISRVLVGGAPKAFIFGETEIWPGILSIFEERRVPIVMVNARLSESSFRWFKRLSFFLAAPLSGISAICASNKSSAERFKALGIKESVIVETGNSKYDLQIGSSPSDGAKSIVSQLFTSPGPLLTLGNLRPGEEGLWFRAIKETASNETLRIVVAPRHLEWVPECVRQLERAGLPCVLRTSGRAAMSGELVLLDTLGELSSVYSGTEVAFVGATLVNGLGGHNLLEPARFGAAVVAGPYGDVVLELRQALKYGNGLIEVTNYQDIVSLLIKLKCSADELKAIGQNARSVAKSFEGATSRTIEIIKRVIK